MTALPSPLVHLSAPSSSPASSFFFFLICLEILDLFLFPILRLQPRLHHFWSLTPSQLSSCRQSATSRLHRFGIASMHR